jgi:putative hemolysin
MSLLVWVPVLLVISFLFSGMESGLLSISQVRMRHLAHQGDRAARRLERLLKHPTRLLATVLLITSLLNIAALVILAGALVGWLGREGYAVAFLLALPVFLFGVDLLPKSMFRRFPHRLLGLLVPLLEVAAAVLYPVLGFAARFGKWMLPTRVRGAAGLFAAREDFKWLASEGERHGMLSGVERRMIHDVVDFSHVRARDVMIPAEKMASLLPQTPVAEVLRMADEGHYDRLPVLAPDGSFLGLINVLELLLAQGTHRTLGATMRRIVTVSADEPAFALLRKMRAARLTLAGVVDAEGRPLGIVAEEDLVDRLVRQAHA